MLEEMIKWERLGKVILILDNRCLCIRVMVSKVRFGKFYLIYRKEGLMGIN